MPLSHKESLLRKFLSLFRRKHRWINLQSKSITVPKGKHTISVNYPSGDIFLDRKKQL